MDDLAEEFREYADWADDQTPLYGRLARATADDPLLLDIAADSRPEQPAPDLLFAAVHSLLLDGREHRLAQYYPTRGGDDAAPDPGPAFREFCKTHEDRLRQLVATRRVQTNDVGRAAALVPAFERVARRADRDLALVEVGASAGLNLNWDRYGYEFGTDGTDGATATVGDDDSPVRIETELRGDRRPPLPETPPRVASRAGVDLNPLDPTDPDDARWLRALVHPDKRWRHDRLEGALELAGAHPPRVVEGDVLDELPALLSAAPDDAELVVYSTYVLYQLPAEVVAELRSLLAEHSAERPINWLSLDPAEHRAPAVYRHVRFEGGDAVAEEQIAEFEPYGTWLRWLGDEPDTSRLHGRREPRGASEW